jgi:hypothetical protein
MRCVNSFYNLTRQESYIYLILFVLKSPSKTFLFPTLPKKLTLSGQKYCHVIQKKGLSCFVLVFVFW